MRKRFFTLFAFALACFAGVDALAKAITTTTVTHSGTSVTTVTTSGGATTAAAPTRWFSDYSPWNLQIAPDHENAKFGEAPLEAFRETGGSVTLNHGIWTVTLLNANSATPRYDIRWSTWLLKNVPIPASTFPAISWLQAHGDTDRGICIYDAPNHQFFTFWQPLPDPANPGSLTVNAGGVFRESGSGWWDNTQQPWTGSASGRSYCAGVVTPAELAAGNIPHALGAGWPHMLIRSANTPGATVYPAMTTDGGGTDPNTALPMGSRLQLDPTLTDAQLKAMGLKSGDITIAHAMQTYGVYIVDSSGSFGFSLASDLGQNVYPTVTNTWPKQIMNYFHATVPMMPSGAAPLENRLLVGQPISTMGQ